jgi:2-polyprenyl-6-hydroxyphenyl methylase/3-demethylubiquinone-9 3-methyltransferase
MSVEHELFEKDAHLWWSDNSHCALLHSLVPARIDYLRKIFTERLGNDLSQATVLDVGCGGGLFAEEVARLGCQVTGVDLSPRSIEMAKRHAEQMGLPITYHAASGEQLPFQDNGFDMVFCCDVLEHVNDPNQVIAESARVLKSGGIYLYDTINRTWLSKFLMITLMQKWLRVIPSDLHDWKKFITPAALQRILKHHGLQPCDMIGLIPSMNPIANVKRMLDIRKVKRGMMSYAELGRGMLFRPSRFRLMNYMGYAIKDVSRTE